MIYATDHFKKNDTERLEKLFDLYTYIQMTVAAAPAKGKQRKAGANT